MERPDAHLGVGDMTNGIGNRHPSQKRDIEELQREIRKLWQALGKSPAIPVAQEEKTFSWAGSVTAATPRTSGPWFPSARVVISSGTIGFETAANGTVNVALRVDGVTQHTFSIAGGQVRSAELMRVAVEYGQAVQIYVSGASGGSGLTFTAGYSREVGVI